MSSIPIPPHLAKRLGRRAYKAIEASVLRAQDFPMAAEGMVPHHIARGHKKGEAPALVFEIHPLHLLHTLAQAKGSFAQTLLEAEHIKPTTIQALISTTYRPTYGTPKPIAPPVPSPLYSNVLLRALHVARKFHQPFVGTEHLLWATIKTLREERILPARPYAVLMENLEELLEHSLPLFPNENDLRHLAEKIEHARDAHASPSKRTRGNIDKNAPARVHVHEDGYDDGHEHTHDDHDHEYHHEDERTGRHAARRSPKKSALQMFCQDLTAQAKREELDVLVGREKELAQLIQILLRRTKNNALVVGEPGVGKTALVQGLAIRIARGNVPSALRKTKIWALDLGAFVAGTVFRGDFETRMRVLLEELADQRGILFIDEIHGIVGAGSAQGSIDAAHMLKPALAAGGMRCIGITTTEEYKKYIEKDKALLRRFRTVFMKEETPEQSVRTLSEIKPALRQHYQIDIQDEALQEAVRLAVRYIPDRMLPDKALDLVEEAAGALAFGEEKNTVTAEDIRRIVQEISGMPLAQLEQNERHRFLHLEEEIRARLVGQEEAIRTVCDVLRRNRAGLQDERRPLGSFLFLGPSGVGKTELAKLLARSLWPHEEKTIPANFFMFDMSEYAEAHTISRLLGAPPGYIGYEEGGQLTERVRMRPYSVVLFDEIEKAHPSLFNILLQILEEGVLTDSHARRVSFANTIVVMTSNIGTEAWFRKERLGFSSAHTDSMHLDQAREGAREELRNIMRPEILNRIDHTVLFRPLTPAHMNAIVDMHLTALQKRLASLGKTFAWDASVSRNLAYRAFLPEEGARAVRRVIQQEVEAPMATLMLEKDCKEIHASVKKGKIIFS